MSLRKLLLALGVLFIVAGLALSAVWVRQVAVPVTSGVKQAPISPARLVAMRDLPAGTLLRPGDFNWKEFAFSQPAASTWMLRGKTNDAELIGSVTRRPFAEGEPLMAIELVKPGDRRFLAAVLRAGYRAVSIAVDPAQTSSGLMLAGDYVDVILTQNFGDNVAKTGRRTVSETILRNVRVVAVDQSLGPQTKPGSDGVIQVDTRIPKTVSLEVTERQGHALSMANQLGKLQLAVRALEWSGSGPVEDKSRPEPGTWASDISAALRQLDTAAATAAAQEAAQALAKQRSACDDKSRCVPNTEIVRNIRKAPSPGCLW